MQNSRCRIVVALPLGFSSFFFTRRKYANLQKKQKRSRTMKETGASFSATHVARRIFEQIVTRNKSAKGRLFSAGLYSPAGIRGIWGQPFLLRASWRHTTTAVAVVVTVVTPRRITRNGRAVILDPPKATVILYAQPVRPVDSWTPRLRPLAGDRLSRQKRKVTERYARINRQQPPSIHGRPFVGGGWSCYAKAHCDPRQSQRIHLLFAFFFCAPMYSLCSWRGDKASN